MKIDPEAWYTPGSPEMNKIATKPTLANWRSQGVGPEYSKVGNRILYPGSGIIAYLNLKMISLKQAA